MPLSKLPLADVRRCKWARRERVDMLAFKNVDFAFSRKL
jgi:hypothetical protein